MQLYYALRLYVHCTYILWAYLRIIQISISQIHICAYTYVNYENSFQGEYPETAKKRGELEILHEDSLQHQDQEAEQVWEGVGQPEGGWALGGGSFDEIPAGEQEAHGGQPKVGVVGFVDNLR